MTLRLTNLTRSTLLVSTILVSSGFGAAVSAQTSIEPAEPAADSLTKTEQTVPDNTQVTKPAAPAAAKTVPAKPAAQAQAKTAPVKKAKSLDDELSEFLEDEKDTKKAKAKPAAKPAQAKVEAPKAPETPQVAAPTVTTPTIAKPATPAAETPKVAAPKAPEAAPVQAATPTPAPATAPVKPKVAAPAAVPAATPVAKPAAAPAAAPVAATPAVTPVVAKPATKPQVIPAMLQPPALKAVKVPTDPIEKAAFDVLQKHCARCHQEGMIGKRLKVAKNFGNVLDMSAVAKDPHLVLPGNPDGSKIIQQLLNQEMPYDLYYEFADVPDVTENDILALRKWVEKLGKDKAGSCATRKFVTNGDMVSAMARDLEKTQDVRVPGTRYITLTHIYNACGDDKEMEVYRQGVVKLLNSLSRSSDVVTLNTIDKNKTILKFNITDLGWNEGDWERLLAQYPYAVRPDTPLFNFLETATLTRLPYIRGDWMAFSASQPPLYHDLLKLPKHLDDLQKKLGIDMKKNIDNFLVKRAGFQRSGVSQNNRLIERHQISTGYFWTSYDFAGNKARQSLFEFPLGPHGKNAFNADGGETIFSLPNGFNAYYVNTLAGDRLDKAPTEIVRDMGRRDLKVTNGISCMGCHDQGIRKAKDDIRPHVLADKTMPRPVRKAVEALYPPHAEMDKILTDDTARFHHAMKRAGLDPYLKLNGVEMINALANRFEKTVEVAMAAAEYGMTKDQLLTALNTTGGEGTRLKRRLEQGLVPRDQFEGMFANLVEKVSDDQLINMDDLKAKKANKQDVAKVKQRPTKEARTFDMTLISDANSYKLNSKPVFTVNSTRDCFLTLVNVDKTGHATVIFPNKFQQDNFVKAGKDLQFPGAGAPFQFRLGDRGTEAVIAVCNLQNRSVDGILNNFRKSAFTDLGNYSKFLARKITVEAKPSNPAVNTTSGKPVKGKLSDIVARAAIKIEVH